MHNTSSGLANKDDEDDDDMEAADAAISSPAPAESATRKTSYETTQVLIMRIIREIISFIDSRDWADVAAAPQINELTRKLRRQSIP